MTDTFRRHLPNISVARDIQALIPSPSAAFNKRSWWEPRSFHRTDHVAETAHPVFWRVPVHHFSDDTQWAQYVLHIPKPFQLDMWTRMHREPTPAPSHLKSAVCSESRPSMACTPLDLHCPPWKHGYFQHPLWMKMSSWPIRHGILSCRSPEDRSSALPITKQRVNPTTRQQGANPFHP